MIHINFNNYHFSQQESLWPHFVWPSFGHQRLWSAGTSTFDIFLLFNQPIKTSNFAGWTHVSCKRTGPTRKVIIKKFFWGQFSKKWNPLPSLIHLGTPLPTLKPTLLNQIFRLFSYVSEQNPKFRFFGSKKCIDLIKPHIVLRNSKLE